MQADAGTCDGCSQDITVKHTGGIVAPALIQYHTEQTEHVRASALVRANLPEWCGVTITTMAQLMDCVAV